MEEAIDYLYRLATAIRKPSMYTQNAKAQKIALVDEDGFDREQDFLQFAITVVAHRLPGAAPSIRDRLAKSIVMRRKRFLYRRRHQQKLSYRPMVDGVQGQRKNQDDTRTVTVLPYRSQNPAVTVVSSNRRKPPVAPSQTSASAFSASKFQHPATQAGQSRATYTIAPSSEHASSLEIPRPPKALPGSKEAECHYCCLMLPIMDFNPKEWRSVCSQNG